LTFFWERNEIPMFLGISTKDDGEVLLEDLKMLVGGQ
jgi:hypothetical protein